MTNTESTKRVTVIYDPNFSRGGSVRVHAVGCRDIAKDARRATTVYEQNATCQAKVAEDFFGDFIGEGSMTEADALAECVFLPCCGLEA